MKHTLYIKNARKALSATAHTAIIFTLALATTACGNHEPQLSATTHADAPITARATVPGAWGSVTRAGLHADSKLSNLQLHYPAAADNGNIKAYTVPDANITQASATDPITFHTESVAAVAGNPGTDAIPALYWKSIAGNGLTEQTLYLTASKEETEAGTKLVTPLWASTTFTPAADANDPRPALNFTTPMKSRMAKLTVTINAEDAMHAHLFAAFLFAKAPDANAATTTEGIKQQAYPTTKDGGASKTNIVYPAGTPDQGSPATPFTTTTSTLLLAPQPVPNADVPAGTVPTDNKHMLVIAYNIADYNGTSTGIPTIDPNIVTHLWTLDLRNVKVTRPGDSEHKDKGEAFAYHPNEHITLTLALKGSNIIIESIDASVDFLPAKKPGTEDDDIIDLQ